MLQQSKHFAKQNAQAPSGATQQMLLKAVHSSKVTLEVFQLEIKQQVGLVEVREKKSRDHVIVSSGWWLCQAGRVEGKAVARGTSSAYSAQR